MSGMQKQNQKQEAKTTAKSNKPEQKSNQQLNAMQMMEASETLRSEDVLAAQQQVGNQVVQRTLGKGKQGAAATDEHGNLRPELASTIQQKRGGGEALPEGIRKEAHKVLGKEFKNVRIHTDSTSDTLSRSVNARAFTIGSDIFFKSGVFAPGTSKGRETLMHELTHVVQQSGSSRSSGGKLKLGAPGTAMEKEADHIGKKHAQAKVGATANAFGTVQKAPIEDDELIQGAPEEEEELQMQPDTGSIVQRVEEEDELQMQPEEEELQMQPDAGNVVQRVEEEELIQGAPEEEEELQMQPDAGNIIQREDDDVFVKGKLDYKKYSKNVLGSHRIAPGISKQVAMFGGSKFDKSETDPKKTTSSTSVTPPQKETPPPLAPRTGTPWKKGVIPKDAQKETPPPLSPRTGTAWKKGVIPKDSQKKTPPPLPTTPRPKLKSGGVPKNVIPKAPELPMPKQTKKDGPLSFSDEIKAKSKSMRSNSQRENLAKLEQDRQQKVGTRVSEQYKEDQANKPKSKWQKIKGLAKSVGSKALGFGKLAGMAALGKAGSAIKGQLTQAKDQFFGKSEEKEEKPSPVTVNVGGGGGGGGAAETISELFQENKKLKAQITELQKEKA